MVSNGINVGQKATKWLAGWGVGAGEPGAASLLGNKGRQSMQVLRKELVGQAQPNTSSSHEHKLDGQWCGAQDSVAATAALTGRCPPPWPSSATLRACWP
mmetsp:Transcript_11414/g.32389  ORF Transcript_11414/g.32389 Transcript_11414/m.32389 type:complete len:100 (+) Transcript_11414:191-490(+)